MSITKLGTFPVKDATGRLLDLGVVKHVMEWKPAESSTLPTWMKTQGTGTFTTVSKSTGKPGMIIQGSTVTGSGAQVTLFEAVSLTGLMGVLFEVVGIETITTPTTPGNFIIGVTKAAATTTEVGGQAIIYQQSATVAKMQTGSPVVNASTDYSPNSSTLRNQNLYKGLGCGLMIDCKNKQMYLLDGDQFVGRMDGRTSMLLPPGESIQPTFSFRPGVAGDQIRISGLRVTLWYD